MNNIDCIVSASLTHRRSFIGVFTLLTLLTLVVRVPLADANNSDDQVDAASAQAEHRSSMDGSLNSANRPVAPEDWTQWRGPSRSGMIEAMSWPDSVSEESLSKRWSVPLSPSYSGPIVVDNLVFTTETRDKKYEVATAFDRETGKKVWSTQWEGAMSVPFFARANGDWIRSTPAYDDGRLYVGGMKDVLVCLDANTGNEIWKVDFPNQMRAPVPSFGFVCSPLIHGDFVYVQAGGGFCKLNKLTGNMEWRTIEDGGGMYGSAFSSPVIATIGGVEQAVVQSRTKMHGIELNSGKELWSIEIPTFRGMNIQTPVVFDDNLFVSTYGGTTQVLKVKREGDRFAVENSWSLPAQGYMNSPVLIDGHIYIHLRNQRFACFDLKSGQEKWRSKPMGKYASMIANGDKILALDERGELLLIKANPNEFQLLSARKVGDDSWAHLAIRGNQIFVRNLKELVAFEWGN